MEIKSLKDLMADFKKLTGLFGVITDIFSEAPDDWDACTDKPQNPKTPLLRISL